MAIGKALFAGASLIASACMAEASDVSTEAVWDATDKAMPSALNLYREILSYPNVTANQDDIVSLNDRLIKEFEARQFEVQSVDAGGSPYLLATRIIDPSLPDVLIYLQADGQPIDPALWNQPDPFDPVLKEKAADGTWKIIPWDNVKDKEGGIEFDREWRVFARSASDSKGPVVQFLTALSAIDAIGKSPAYNLKVVVDTEEEIGSPTIVNFIEKSREALSAEMLLIFDGPPHASNKPTVVFGARGIMTMTLKTYGPRVPQHSGHYGNYIPNPAFAMSRILASMKDAEGRVTIPGFYDGISIPEDVKAELAKVPDDMEALKKRLGFKGNDKVAPTYQQSLQYPSLNIRGLEAMKTGAQVRTLIPATATAEIDVRLVKESDPDKLVGLIIDHVKSMGFYVLDREPTEEERLTNENIVSLTYKKNYGAYRTAFIAPPGLLVKSAMTKLHGKEPILIRTLGGSIPIAPFVDGLGIPAVGVPTVNIDNNQHAPNENIRLGFFRDGIAIAIAVLLEPVPEGQ